VFKLYWCSSKHNNNKALRITLNSCKTVSSYSMALVTVNIDKIIKVTSAKILSAIAWTPQRHFPTSQRGFWAIVRQNPSTGHFSRRVRGKNKNERPCILRISPDAPLLPIGTNFGLRVRLVDIINCAKFYRNRLRGRSLTIPFLIVISLLYCMDYWFARYDCLRSANVIHVARSTVVAELLILLLSIVTYRKYLF